MFHFRLLCYLRPIRTEFRFGDFLDFWLQKIRLKIRFNDLSESDLPFLISFLSLLSEVISFTVNSEFQEQRILYMQAKKSWEFAEIETLKSWYFILKSLFFQWLSCVWQSTVCRIEPGEKKETLLYTILFEMKMGGDSTEIGCGELRVRKHLIAAQMALSKREVRFRSAAVNVDIWDFDLNQWKNQD